MFLYDSASEKHENSTNPCWIFFYNQAEIEMMSKKCSERDVLPVCLAVQTRGANWRRQVRTWVEGSWTESLRRYNNETLGVIVAVDFWSWRNSDGWFLQIILDLGGENEKRRRSTHYFSQIIMFPKGVIKYYNSTSNIYHYCIVANLLLFC